MPSQVHIQGHQVGGSTCAAVGVFTRWDAASAAHNGSKSWLSATCQRPWVPGPSSRPVLSLPASFVSLCQCTLLGGRVLPDPTGKTDLPPHSLARSPHMVLRPLTCSHFSLGLLLLPPERQGLLLPPYLQHQGQCLQCGRHSMNIYRGNE